MARAKRLTRDEARTLKAAQQQRREELQRFPVKECRTVGSVLSRLKLIRSWGSPQATNQLQELWQQVAEDERIRATTRAIKIEAGSLHVIVSSSAIKSEIMHFHATQIIARWNDAAGASHKIRALKLITKGQRT